MIGEGQCPDPDDKRPSVAKTVSGFINPVYQVSDFVTPLRAPV